MTVDQAIQTEPDKKGQEKQNSNLVTTSTQTYTDEQWEAVNIRKQIDEAIEEKEIISLARRNWVNAAYLKTEIAHSVQSNYGKETLLFIDTNEYSNYWYGRKLIQEQPQIKDLIDNGKLKEGKMTVVRTNIEVEEDEKSGNLSSEEKITYIIGIKSTNPEEGNDSTEGLFANCKQLVGKLVRNNTREISVGIAAHTDHTLTRNMLEILLKNTDIKATFYLGDTRERYNRNVGSAKPRTQSRNSLSDMWKTETLHVRQIAEDASTYATAVRKMKTDLDLKKQHKSNYQTRKTEGRNNKTQNSWKNG